MGWLSSEMLYVKMFESFKVLEKWDILNNNFINYFLNSKD